MESRIRVFISYSHKDHDLAVKIVHILENNNIQPLWDDNLMGGVGFNEMIKHYISLSHVFLPILTESSAKRGWVHQEIGYALALHIPVYPLTAENTVPGGMLQMIQAEKIETDEESLSQLLNRENFQNLINNSNSVPLYVCARLPEERAQTMAEYSNKVASIKKYGLVRQRGGLSSFHIPEVSIQKQVWKDRYHPGDRSDFHKTQQRNERLALQKHAEIEGCRLIINPLYGIHNRSNLSAKTRLNTLIEFLQSPAGEKSVIAIRDNLDKKESLTIVGDWFVCESVSFKEGDGFTNTFFTRDFSEINRRINDFESEMEDILKESDWKEEDSRERAIMKLTEIRDGIKL